MYSIYISDLYVTPHKRSQEICGLQQIIISKIRSELFLPNEHINDYISLKFYCSSRGVQLLVSSDDGQSWFHVPDDACRVLPPFFLLHKLKHLGQFVHNI